MRQDTHHQRHNLLVRIAGAGILGLWGAIAPCNTPWHFASTSAQAEVSPMATIPNTVPTPTAALNRPLLKLGSQGVDVLELQGMLKLLGFYNGSLTGTYTEETLIAVTRFQQAAGLSQDGIVGNGTWAKLLPPAPGTTLPSSGPSTSPSASPSATPPSPTAPQTAPPKSSTPIAPPSKTASAPKPQSPQGTTQDAYPVLRKGASGDAVIQLQKRLRAIGLLQSLADGIFGDETEAAVKALQEQAKLDVDGVVGEATWRALQR